MQLNTKAIKSHFEKSMDKYDENAIVQLEMAKKLVSETSEVKNQYNNILELGCGTGVLTKEIKKHISFEKYYVNDLVEKSKNYIDKILDDYTFFHGSALKIKPNQKFDLIISNAMFQWFCNLQEITSHCKNNLNEDGILAFSTFGTENFKELKDVSGLTLNYSSKKEITETLKSDFEILYIDEYIKVLEFNTPLEILAHMKNTGVNSLTAKTWSITKVKDFCEKYLLSYQKPQLTYNPIVVIARIK